MFSTIAYVLLRALRAYGLKETSLESAQVDTIRWKLLKIGTQVEVTARKVWLRMTESYPWRDLFIGVSNRLDALMAPVQAAVERTINSARIAVDRAIESVLPPLEVAVSSQPTSSD
jgi:Transposase DDE domain group 1